MGIENRDYVRGGGSPGSGYGGGYVSSYGGYRGGMPPACKWILIITIAVFVLQLLWTAGPSERQIAEFERKITQALEREGVNPEQIDQVRRQQVRLFKSQRQSVIQSIFELAPDKVLPGFQIWRLVTYAFCHARGDVWHIVFNMLALWFFGPTLERMYGTREFTWFYLMGALAAGVVFCGLEFFMGHLTPVIGASGAVMAVLMLFAIHYPRHTIYIMGIIPIEARWIVAIYLVVDLYPVLLSLGGDVVGDGVAHSAHLGGLAFGYLYYKFQWRFDRFFGNFKLPEMKSSGGRSGPVSRGNLKLYEPPENIDAKVDEILEKISRSGEASLTDQERELLKTASQRYKKRP